MLRGKSGVQFWVTKFEMSVHYSNTYTKKAVEIYKSEVQERGQNLEIEQGSHWHIDDI